MKEFVQIEWFCPKETVSKSGVAETKIEVTKGQRRYDNEHAKPKVNKERCAELVKSMHWTDFYNRFWCKLVKNVFVLIDADNVPLIHFLISLRPNCISSHCSQIIWWKSSQKVVTIREAKINKKRIVQFFYASILNGFVQ